LKKSLLRLVSALVLMLLALMGLSMVPASASARAQTPRAKHPVAQVTHGAGVGASVRVPATAQTPSDDSSCVDDDDDDDDCDDDEGNVPDPDAMGPTSHLPLPGPGECTDTAYGVGSLGRAAPGARELPEDPP
jgi:hypothetical protein